MKRRGIAYNGRMKIKNTFVVSAMAIAASCASLADGARISISPDAKGVDMPKTMYGIFFEDINYAADGGIYPELLANRGFDWKTKDLEGWEADYRGGAMARITVQENAPLHPNTARHLRMECFGPGTGCGVRNKGFHGVSVEAGKKYDLTFYARGLEGYAGGLRFVLEDGQEVVCEAKLANGKMSVAPKSGALDPTAPEWRRHSFVQVSLFPQETFNGRRNGLRKDLVQLLKDLKPGVLRFPGGCVAEGDSFERWFDWKRTVGALERRETIWNIWGYWQSFGLGYYEYFCLAEDIGAEPLPICLAGITCQFRGPKLAPLDSMDYFAQSICDLVDFANADPKKNKWGARERRPQEEQVGQAPRRDGPPQAVQPQDGRRRKRELGTGLPRPLPRDCQDRAREASRDKARLHSRRVADRRRPRPRVEDSHLPDGRHG